MGLGYRISRAVILFVPAAVAIFGGIAMEGLSLVFAGTLLTGAFLTLIYLFIHFDQYINPKIIMEFLTDAFIGVVLITYPSPNIDFYDRYFLVLFSIWFFINGVFMVTSGIMDKGNKPWFWIYVLVGFMFITLGFVLINYNPDYIGSLHWLVAFMLIIYAAVELYLLLRRKVDYFPFRENEM